MKLYIKAVFTSASVGGCANDKWALTNNKMSIIWNALLAMKQKKFNFENLYLTLACDCLFMANSF